MSQDTTQQSDAGPWIPSRGGRIAVGLLAGFGSTGIAAGLGLIGTFIDVDLPLVDPSALILIAPVIIIPGFAGALLRGRAVVVAITVGAVAGPSAAIFAIDGSCSSNMWAAVGLAAAAAYVLVIAGLAAFVGDRIGGSDRFERKRFGAVAGLVVIGAIGVVAWIAAVAKLGGCP
jgi:hypothetical protein